MEKTELLYKEMFQSFINKYFNKLVTGRAYFYNKSGYSEFTSRLHNS